MKERTKNIIVSLGALIVFLAIFVVCCYVEHNYTREATCTEIHTITENNEEITVVTFTDKGGYKWKWEMEENEHFTINEKVKLKMNDNCSTNCLDDIITKVVVEK